MSDHQNYGELLSLLGLVKKARKLSEGYDAVLQSILTGRAALVLIGMDASQKAAAKLIAAADDRSIEYARTAVSMENIGAALGRGNVGFISIDDKGFSQAAAMLLQRQVEQKERSL